MIRPFMSSEGIRTLRTVESATCSAANRWMAMQRDLAAPVAGRDLRLLDDPLLSTCASCCASLADFG